jgi:hypothetical protein
MNYSAKSLNERPWGDQESRGQAQTAQQLNTREYSTSPFAAGLQAADYRVLHAEYGESFRFWHAVNLPGTNRSGLTYQEVTLGSIAKARFHSGERDQKDAEFGRLPAGQTLISCLREVTEIVAGDKLVRTSPRLVRTQSASVVRDSARGAGAFDALPHRFVAGVLSVKVDGVRVETSRYRMVPATGPGDAQKGGIEWLSDPPVAGTRLFVEYRYHPYYLCLGEGMRSAPIGRDGEMLPQRVLLREEKD